MVLNLGEDQGQDEDGYDDQPGWISPSWPQTPTEVPHDGTGPSRHSSLSSASSGSPYAQQAARPPSRPDHTDARYSLPRLSTVAPPHHLTGQPRPACTPGSPYSPLTPEDRKALNSFRVVL